MQFESAYPNQPYTAREGCIKFSPTITVQTPAFVPIIYGHQLDQFLLQELYSIGFRLINVVLLNYLQQPGWDWLAKQGRLHHFFAWPGAVLTEIEHIPLCSFKQVTRNENAVTLRSLVDGALLTVDFAVAMNMQEKLGADLWTSSYLKKEDTIKDQPLVTRYLPDFPEFNALPRPIGSPRYWQTQLEDLAMIKATMQQQAIDLVSTPHPAQAAQRGQVLTKQGVLAIQQPCYELDFTSIEESCACPTCLQFSRAYLHHLICSREMLGVRLLAIHNFFFYRHFLNTAPFV